MAMARPALLLALALALAPACGHKGPPLPPRRHTPPSLVDFRLAQRGDSLELSCTAPATSIEGVQFDLKVDYGTAGEVAQFALRWNTPIQPDGRAERTLFLDAGPNYDLEIVNPVCSGAGDEALGVSGLLIYNHRGQTT